MAFCQTLGNAGNSAPTDAEEEEEEVEETQKNGREEYDGDDGCDCNVVNPTGIRSPPMRRKIRHRNKQSKNEKLATVCFFLLVRAAGKKGPSHYASLKMLSSNCHAQTYVCLTSKLCT